MSKKQEAVFISEMPKTSGHAPTHEEKEAAYQKYIRPNRKDKYSKWKAVVPAEDVNAVISAAIYYDGDGRVYETPKKDGTFVVRGFGYQC